MIARRVRPVLRPALAAMAVGLSLANPLSAALAQEDNGYRQLLDLDARVQSIGWKLVRANAPFCTRTLPAIGLLLQDARSWSDPAAMRDALGLTSDIAVGAVATGSPADRAGLAVNQPVTAIDGKPVDQFPVAESGDYRRLAALHDTIDEALRRDGAVAITVGGDNPATITIPGELACASRFELLTSGDSARADGERVLVSRKLVDDIPEDVVLAGAIAHELGHNLLRHPQKRSEEGKSWGKVRHNEREADRLSAWLLANAGIDTIGAVRFQREWMRGHDWGILAPTHDAWDERIDVIEEERALIAQQSENGAATGEYDWSDRFPMSREDARP